VQAEYTTDKNDTRPCTYTCPDNFTWDGFSCVAQTFQCYNKPNWEGYVFSDKDPTVSKSWEHVPDDTLNANLQACQYKCNTAGGYAWDESQGKCLKPDNTCWGDEPEYSEWLLKWPSVYPNSSYNPKNWNYTESIGLSLNPCYWSCKRYYQKQWNTCVRVGASGVCTGPVPQHSVFIQNTDIWLQVDTLRKLYSNCNYSTNRKCGYCCDTANNYYYDSSTDSCVKWNYCECATTWKPSWAWVSLWATGYYSITPCPNPPQSWTPVWSKDSLGACQWKCDEKYTQSGNTCVLKDNPEPTCGKHTLYFNKGNCSSVTKQSISLTWGMAVNPNKYSTGVPGNWYTFSWWSTSPNGSITWLYYMPCNNDATLYAVCRSSNDPNPTCNYTITYSGNGWKWSDWMVEKKVTISTCGEITLLSSAPTKDKDSQNCTYNFAGWKSSQDWNIYPAWWKYTPSPSNTNFTMIAQWNKSCPSSCSSKLDVDPNGWKINDKTWLNIQKSCGDQIDLVATRQNSEDDINCRVNFNWNGWTITMSYNNAIIKKETKYTFNWWSDNYGSHTTGVCWPMNWITYTFSWNEKTCRKKANWKSTIEYTTGKILLPGATRTNYIFSGWYTAWWAFVWWSWSEYSPSICGIELYAHWKDSNQNVLCNWNVKYKCSDWTAGTHQSYTWMNWNKYTWDCGSNHCYICDESQGWQPQDPNLHNGVCIKNICPTPTITRIEWTWIYFNSNWGDYDSISIDFSETNNSAWEVVIGHNIGSYTSPRSFNPPYNHWYLKIRAKCRDNTISDSSNAMEFNFTQTQGTRCKIDWKWNKFERTPWYIYDSHHNAHKLNSYTIRNYSYYPHSSFWNQVSTQGPYNVDHTQNVSLIVTPCSGSVTELPVNQNDYYTCRKIIYSPNISITWYVAGQSNNWEYVEMKDWEVIYDRDYNWHSLYSYNC
jgi:hypothetical protein